MKNFSFYIIAASMDEYMDLIRDMLKVSTGFLVLQIMKSYVAKKQIPMNTTTFQAVMFLNIGMMVYHLIVLPGFALFLAF